MGVDVTMDWTCTIYIIPACGIVFTKSQQIPDCNVAHSTQWLTFCRPLPVNNEESKNNYTIKE